MFLIEVSPSPGLNTENQCGQTTSAVLYTLTSGMLAGKLSRDSIRTNADPGNMSKGLRDKSPPAKSATPMAAVGVPWCGVPKVMTDLTRLCPPWC